VRVRTFGKYLRELRENRGLSQGELGKKVRRTAMAISLFEKGTNNPPNNNLLNALIRALELSDEEADMLRNLSAIERNELPNDISNYIKNHMDVFNAIRRGMRQNKKSTDWENVFKGAGQL
jgi:transcriptional regulator with XRE-family HTH domain